MAYQLKIGEANVIPAGTVLFEEKEPIENIIVVVKGNLIAISDYIKIPLPVGTFFGIPDTINGRALTAYKATENSVVYPFDAAGLEDLRYLLQDTNKDYKGMVVASLAKYYGELARINEQYMTMSQMLCPKLNSYWNKYVNSCKNGGMAIGEAGGLTSLTPFKDENPVSENEKYFFMEMSMIPTNVMKAYYGDTIEVAMDSIERIAKATLSLVDSTMKVGEYYNDNYSLIYNDGEQNLISMTIRLAKELEKAGRIDRSLEGLAKELKDLFDKCEKIALSNMGAARPANRDRLNKLYDVLSGSGEVAAVSADSGAQDEDYYRSLKNSLRSIMSFGKIEPELAAQFEEAINKFVDSTDRLSTEDAGRVLRRNLTELFYKVYREVFVAYLDNPALPKPVELFLNYGYCDERLVTKEQAIELCKLKVQTTHNYFCNIYTLPEWLKAVYDGKREPSKNEFDLEYMESLREQLKTKEITEDQAKALSADQMAKLDFEIFKVFKYNHRIVNGALSTFVPVLCSDQISGSLFKAVLTKDRIGQTVEKVRELDFSAFYRELLYANKDYGIEKETIQMEVGPDMVLFPCFGANGVMWQEISCKHRDSAGRFFFPMLFDGDVEDIYMRCLGRYRWELCRTMQGSAWNNIQYKSLTSEYSDYIQYYKKNHDLTDDKKEKIKLQLQKAKNSSKEVFVQDYILWMKFEANGGMKLNKISREILAVYCPFAKEVRKNLETQPAFQDSIGRYNRESLKKAKELDLRIRALSKGGKEMPEIMMNTLKLYKDM